jgi:hypothetical protein
VSIPRVITHDWLAKHGACEIQRKVFAAEWPDGVVLSEQSLYRAAELGLDLWWFARQYFPAPLLAEYQRQEAPLWTEYERQRALLLAEYERQRASLLAEYERQVAPLLWRIARAALEEEGGEVSDNFVTCRHRAIGQKEADRG